MSGSLSTLVAAGAPIVSLLLRPARALGPLTIPVVMEERHSDAMPITRHPVEQGAKISDHAYLNPVELTIQGRWSNSSLQAIASLFTGGDILGALTDGAFGTQSFVQQQYKKVLALQASRIPFTITTGKRQLTSMLISLVTEVTNSGTEYSLALDIHCTQVIIVSTQSTTLPPAVNQSAPQSTASPANAGTQQAAPVDPNSILKNTLPAGGVSGLVSGAQKFLGGL